MALISKLWWALLLAVQFAVGGALRLLWALLGRPSWQAPAWPAQLWQSAAAHPGRSVLVLGTLAALGSASHWYLTRPQPAAPEQASLSVQEPRLTDYRRAPIAVAPLRVEFSRSVAPLAQVDQPAEGIRIKPELAGQWRWNGDRSLEFQPVGDWPAGERFTVNLDPARTIAAQARLQEYEFQFDTPRFVVGSGASEFYQDPRQATLKKGIFALEFSHPVQPASLERAIRLRLSDGGGSALPTPAFTVNYDEARLQAWIHSAPLELPANGGNLQLELAAGVQGTPQGARSDEPLHTQIRLPALYSLSTRSVEAVLVDNARFEPEQVLMLNFNFAVRDRDVQQAVRAWVLPAQHPERSSSSRWNWSAAEVTDAILQAATPLPLHPIASERESIEMHSFRYEASQGAQLYVRIDKGLESFGGYRMGQNAVSVLRTPDFPRLLKFVAEGSLLSLRGERKLSVVSRNVPGLKLEVARILPQQLHHLVNYNRGSYGKPTLYAPTIDDLAERFEHSRALPAGDPGTARYEGLDLGEFLAPGKRGVFMLRLLHFNPAQPDQRGSQSDQRLVVLTDLGLIVKRQKDGSRVVFVASLASGEPVAGATISVIGSNGEPVVSARSSDSGRVELPDLTGFERERRPVMISARLGDDVSFLPLGDSARDLELSRFAVDGDVNPATAGTLDAHLFSDRGLYRPGDTMHFGLIVRAADWQTTLTGLPVQVELLDPQGSTLLNQPIALGALGFEELSYRTQDSASTGSYTLSLYLQESQHHRTELGHVTVRVREFLPDRMKVRATLSASATQGWVKPDGLSARVEVSNLFGTPAQDRRVEARVSLLPFWPRFAAFPDHQFFDPRRAQEGFEEVLSDVQTDAAGVASFQLPLAGFADSTFELRFSAQAYEAAGGRSVAAEASTLVSANDYLLGVKNTGNLGYVRRGEQRVLQLLAVDPQLRPLALAGVRAVLIEQRHVSLLTQQSSGAWKYQSQLREHTLAEHSLDLPAHGNGLPFTLLTEQPGSFRLELRNSNDTLLNEVRYTVVGDANLTRSLERNAELELKLARGEYAPGEQLELSIRAPYTGSGLITIERDKVYAHRWFKASTLSSVQTITVPEGLEAGAYVNVQFVRDPDSAEVFTSPLSHAVVPFTINRAARTAQLQLDTPARIRPGETLKIGVRSATPVRAAVFVVDVGILQVARYTLADPLNHFLRKRMLEVSTAQILDLLLPEFSRLAALAAAGGDDESSAGRNLNPFKRKRDLPAVHWFGLRQIDRHEEFHWQLPDTFNGALKIMVVAVGAQKIGIAQTQTEVRGEFVLSPNVPTTVAPGDRFEVSLGVADNREHADAAQQPVQLELKAPASLKVVGEAVQQLSLQPGSETVVIWQLEAQQQLGTPELVFSASAGAARVQQTVGMSQRPALPRHTRLSSGRSEGRSVQLDDNRVLWDEFARRQFSAARAPLVLLDGLSGYLDDFPHRCTEQLLSQGMAGLVYTTHPELAAVRGDHAKAHAGLLELLLGRQNEAGAFGLWEASADTDPFVSVYAVLYLLEARERGLPVPAALLQQANAYLRTVAVDESFATLDQQRVRAFAIYLLTRQGEVTSNALLAARQQLDADHPQQWQADSSALLLAASYAGLKQDDAARPLLTATVERLRRTAKLSGGWQRSAWHDALIGDALSLYLLNRHFPEQARQLSVTVLEHLLLPIEQGYYNTLSSALAMLAIEAYAVQAAQGDPIALYGIAADGSEAALAASAGLLQRAEFTAAHLRLRLDRGAGPGAVWYVRTEGGFDRQLPGKPLAAGIEVQRSLVDERGVELSELSLGQELTMRIRLRSTDDRQHANIAIIDLLPGGFEIIEPEADEEGYRPPLVQSDAQVQHVDAREDRMLIYTQAGPSLATYSYRVKATAAGSFQLPPAYAESMYQREIRSHGGGEGRIEVRRP